VYDQRSGDAALVNPLGSPARGTPSARTPDAAQIRVAGDARASQAVARALVLLVERVETLTASSAATLASAQAGARDALRQLTARSRDGALLCRIADGVMVLAGVPISRGLPDDRRLDLLAQRLLAIGAGSLTVREGAAPGELLTLARLLARQPAGDAPNPGTDPTARARVMRETPPPFSDTPTTVRVFGFADDAPRELLRSWSVLVTPVPSPPVDPPTSSPAGSTLARLAAARTDDAATSVVATLIQLLDDAQRRGDAAVIEGVARGAMIHLHVVGVGGGRLAVEALLRHLLRPALLSLVAQRLPHSADRAALLQLLARAGDAGVETLLEQLMATDDPLARRAYFDGIVAMDVGSPLLFDLLLDSRWFVVRNAAALLGEMNVAQTDVALLPLLQHKDERIRIAVARALTRVRTPKALQGLHAAIDDPHAEVRRLAAASFGLAGGASGGMRPPAARLSLALEREADDDVALEMLAALGRLGSADAVQRLLRVAMPASQDFTSGDRATTTREPWLRIAAMEALVRARGHAVIAAIESLQADADSEVAAAASRLRASVVSDR